MKKILSVFIMTLVVCACTKHDPFNNYVNGEFVEISGGGQQGEEDGLWILSKFAPGNLKSFNNSWKPSFYETDNYIPSETSYFYYYDLKFNKELDRVYSDGEGQYWRLPTSGELKMAFPEFVRNNDPAFGNMTSILIFSWVPTSDSKFTTLETAYLDNKSDYTADLSGEIKSGESVFYYDENNPDGNPDVFPIYALRFKGTSQYAAYRYEIKEMTVGENYIYYLNLKAKWLKEDDYSTTIEDISQDSYWSTDFLELNFRMDGYFDSEKDLINTLGYKGVLLSSTYGRSRSGDWGPVVAEFSGSSADLHASSEYNKDDCACPVRLLNCKADGSL